jgi:hypothetical protein
MDDDSDAFLDRWTLNEMDEDAKVHWAKPLTSLATVNSRFPGTLGSLVERQKVMNLHSTTLLLADRQVWIIGKTWEIWAWNVLGY